MQVGTALSIPPTAVLSFFIGVCEFILSPSIIYVEDTDWKEPVLLWECVFMPTGSGKSQLCAGQSCLFLRSFGDGGIMLTFTPMSMRNQWPKLASVRKNR